MARVLQRRRGLSDRHSHSPAEARRHHPRGLHPLTGEQENWGQKLTDQVAKVLEFQPQHQSFQ